MNNALSGRKVLVTCEKELAGKFALKLSGVGASVTLFPAIEIQPVTDWTIPDKHIAAWGEYNWIIFTSRHAAKYLFRRMDALGVKNIHPQNTLVAAVGESTKNMIERKGWGVSFIPEKLTAFHLAETLPGIEGMKILFPHGNKMNAAVPDELRRRGAQVDEVIVYTNEDITEEQPAGILSSGKFDFVTFMSPSAVTNVKNFIARHHISFSYSSIIAMGPQTENAACREFEQVVPSDIPSLDGLIQKMIQHDLSPAKITR